MAAPKLDFGWSPEDPFFDWLGPIRRKYAEKIHIIFNEPLFLGWPADYK